MTLSLINYDEINSTFIFLHITIFITHFVFVIPQEKPSVDLVTSVAPRVEVTFVEAKVRYLELLVLQLWVVTGCQGQGLLPLMGKLNPLLVWVGNLWHRNYEYEMDHHTPVGLPDS